MAVSALAMLEEGVGDEVTLVSGVFLLVLAMVLAWLSTHVAENGEHMAGAFSLGGASVPLGPDPYRGTNSSSDPAEPQTTTQPQEEKSEDEDSEQDTSEEMSLENAAELAAPTVSSLDEHLDIQGLHKRTVVVNGQKPESRTTGETLQSSSASDIRVRLKLLNDTEKVISLSPNDTIGLLKSKCFSGKEPQIKLIFHGQLLSDPSQTLFSLNITHNSVIHCHISRDPPSDAHVSDREARSGDGSFSLQTEVRVPPGPGGITDSALDMSVGSLVVPMFVVMLAMVWYFRLNYRQLFTAPATISLVGVTIFFSFLIFGMYGR